MTIPNCNNYLTWQFYIFTCAQNRYVDTLNDYSQELSNRHYPKKKSSKAHLSDKAPRETATTIPKTPEPSFPPKAALRGYNSPQ